MPKKPPSTKDILQAMGYVRQKSEQLAQKQGQMTQDIYQALSETDAVLDRYADLIQEPVSMKTTPTQQVISPSQTEGIHTILQKSREQNIPLVRFEHLLTQTEIRQVIAEYETFEDQWEQDRRLDRSDMLAVGVVSSLSVCLNLICVGEGTAQAGKQLLTWLGAPTAHIKDSAKVSFDKVLPKAFGASGNHRWNSLSHHVTPAGFVHAVRDVLLGTSTHVVNGEVRITDNITHGSLYTWTKEYIEIPIIGDLLTACKIVLQHWWSDVNTALGLPGPLMMLAKFLEFGSISYGGETLTVAQFAQKLFEAGMDMRRFIGDSIIVVLSEILMRAWFFFRTLHEGKGWSTAFSQLKMHSKLQKALLTVHGSSCLVQAGKVYLTANPLLINPAQWLAFGRYLLGYLQSGVTKSQKKDADHLQRWIEKMREEMNNLTKLEQHLSNFPNWAL